MFSLLPRRIFFGGPVPPPPTLYLQVKYITGNQRMQQFTSFLFQAIEKRVSTQSLPIGLSPGAFHSARRSFILLHSRSTSLGTRIWQIIPRHHSARSTHNPIKSYERTILKPFNHIKSPADDNHPQGQIYTLIAYIAFIPSS